MSSKNEIEAKKGSADEKVEVCEIAVAAAIETACDMNDARNDHDGTSSVYSDCNILEGQVLQDQKAAAEFVLSMDEEGVQCETEDHTTQTVMENEDEASVHSEHSVTDEGNESPASIATGSSMVESDSRRRPIPSNRRVTMPGAVAVGGLDGSTGTEDDEYTFTSPPTTPQPSSIVQTVTARLVVDIENDVEDLQEELEERNREVERLRQDRENAALAQVVDQRKCLEGPRRKLIGLAAFALLAALAIVISVVLVVSREPPDDPVARLISSVSFDGGEALRTKGTPQNKAFNWLANFNTDLESYSNERKIQRYVLATLYYSTNGESWGDNTGWLTDSNECDDWYNGANGLFCSNDGSVVELDLWGNNLVGTMPAAELALLPNIAEINFSWNFLTGTIPTEIGLATTLYTLLLSDNSLFETIPTEISRLTNLDWLELYNNNFSGTIPTEIAQLTNLDSLSLSNNDFLAGTIPTEIAQLTNLNRLNLSKNYLTGTIPSEINQLTRLGFLYLSDNGLTGTIPTEIAQLTNLDGLWLFNNSFTGSFTCPDFITECYI